ncbi:hypothetical protein [Paenibacillus campinasensis]|uniref:Uncharacterized protein n=1 Tax=Paenibacillus campinasensis TaxID=66347 RepID=A0A268F272_9BACL|nr:hypothetical protein [Paenibacillus campinasensis]PAD79434.1 hypothetical protein CHH67_04330 [Paenibacillus campinasensis]
MKKIFQEASHHQVLLNQPAPGAYELTASAPDAAAYLMAAQFHRPQDFKISLKSTRSEIQLQQQDQTHVNNISYDISYFGEACPRRSFPLPIRSVLFHSLMPLMLAHIVK